MDKALSEKIAKAVEVMKNVEFDQMEQGKYVVNDDFYMMLQTYLSNDPKDVRYEAHKKYVDVQYIVEGTERMDIAPVSILEAEEAYDEERDVAFFKVPKRAASVVLTAGSYAVLYPEDAHRPGMRVGESMPVKKIVGKVRI